jgi:hypothetical protein
VSAATPAITRPARAPNSAARTPAIGPPIGVVPMKTIANRAITRPRIEGSAASCNDELTPAAKVTEAAPSGTSAAAVSSRVGAVAAASANPPKASAETTRTRGPTVPRAPEARAPITAPTPIATASPV